MVPFTCRMVFLTQSCVWLQNPVSGLVSDFLEAILLCIETSLLQFLASRQQLRFVFISRLSICEDASFIGFADSALSFANRNSCVTTIQQCSALLIIHNWSESLAVSTCNSVVDQMENPLTMHGGWHKWEIKCENAWFFAPGDLAMRRGKFQRKIDGIWIHLVASIFSDSSKTSKSHSWRVGCPVASGWLRSRNKGCVGTCKWKHQCEEKPNQKLAHSCTHCCSNCKWFLFVTKDTHIDRLKILWVMWGASSFCLRLSMISWDNMRSFLLLLEMVNALRHLVEEWLLRNVWCSISKWNSFFVVCFSCLSILWGSQSVSHPAGQPASLSTSRTDEECVVRARVSSTTTVSPNEKHATKPSLRCDSRWPGRSRIFCSSISCQEKVSGSRHRKISKWSWTRI